MTESENFRFRKRFFWVGKNRDWAGLGLVECPRILLLLISGLVSLSNGNLLSPCPLGVELSILKKAFFTANSFFFCKEDGLFELFLQFYMG